MRLVKRRGIMVTQVSKRKVVVTDRVVMVNHEANDAGEGRGDPGDEEAGRDDSSDGPEGRKGGT